MRIEYAIYDTENYIITRKSLISTDDTENYFITRTITDVHG